MKRSASVLALLAACTLAACSSPELPLPSDSAGSASSASQAASVRETPNVSYEGTIEAAGLQAAYRLRLGDGRMMVLESQNIDLGRYVGKSVMVFGASRPEDSGSAIIMRVEEVLMMEEESSSANVFFSSSEESSVAENSSATMSIGASRAAITSSAIAQASQASSTEPTVEDATSVDVSARAALMAKDNLGDANWTQKYCTSHIGFCIPIHRNWWFKSFGTTTTSLWHVEISSSEIQGLGDGPIVVKLLGGTVASKKATDGQVRVQGDIVVGFKTWNDSDHFEVTAPASLQAAVAYIVGHLAATATGQ